MSVAILRLILETDSLDRGVTDLRPDHEVELRYLKLKAGTDKLHGLLEASSGWVEG